MKIRHLRNATFQLHCKGMVLLVDPVLGRAQSTAPVEDSPNQRPNPLVELPISVAEAVKVDGCLVTHMHRDHFDSAAGKLLPKTMPIFCQPEDTDKLKQLGFFDVQAVSRSLVWRDITVSRTGGQHGTGDIGKQMAPVSGYVLTAAGEPTVYIAGDTIWCPEVADALTRYKPNIVIVNGGGARFNHGDPIIMGKRDIEQVCRQASTAKVVVVHMEAINHCWLSRAELKDFLGCQGLADRVQVPNDGQWLDFS